MHASAGCSVDLAGMQSAAGVGWPEVGVQLQAWWWVAPDGQHRRVDPAASIRLYLHQQAHL